MAKNNSGENDYESRVIDGGAGDNGYKFDNDHLDYDYEDEDEYNDDDDDDYFDDDDDEGEPEEEDLGYVRSLAMDTAASVAAAGGAKRDNKTAALKRPHPSHEGVLIEQNGKRSNSGGPTNTSSGCEKISSSCSKTESMTGEVVKLLKADRYSCGGGVSMVGVAAATPAKIPRMRMSFGGLMRVRTSNVKTTSYDPTKPCAFDRLSDEVIIKILELLPRKSLVSTARTCKRLQAICYDESFWSRVDCAGKVLGPGIVGSILLRGPVVLRMARTHVKPPVFHHPSTTVSFNNQSFNNTTSDNQSSCCNDLLSANNHHDSSSATSSTSLLSSPNNSSLGLQNNQQMLLLPKLQYLDLSMSHIQPESLADLIGACRNLCKLSLERCDLDSSVLSAVSKNLNLVTLNLGMASGVNASGLAVLGASLRNLQELNLGWISLTPDMLEPLRSGLIDGNAQSLRKLNLAGAKDALDDATVKHVVRNCRQLDELDVSDAGTTLTNACIESIVHYASSLERLCMSRCYGITPRAFLDLASCARLGELSAYGMLRDEETLAELRSRLKVSDIKVNVNAFSHIARPTTGLKRTSIWNMRTRTNSSPVEYASLTRLWRNYYSAKNLKYHPSKNLTHPCTVRSF